MDFQRGKADSASITDDLVIHVPQEASGQSSHFRVAAPTPLKAVLSWLLGTCVPCVREGDRTLLSYISEHVLLISERAQRNFDKFSISSSGFGHLLKKLHHARES